MLKATGHGCDSHQLHQGKLMEKKLMWLAVIIILALGITYATLFFGYDFR